MLLMLGGSGESWVKINESLLRGCECLAIIFDPKIRHALGKPIVVELLSVRFFPYGAKNLN